MTAKETGNIRFFTFFFLTKFIKSVVFFATSQKRRKKIKYDLLSEKNIDNVGSRLIFSPFTPSFNF